MIDTYGEAIEYDLLHHLGVDLLDWFRGARPWPQLLRLIDRLPRASQYKAAIAQNDDLADRVLAAGKPKTAGPSVADWTPEVDMLARVVDELRVVVSVLIKVNSKGGKGPDPKPVRRPRTALDRAERRQLQRRYDGWVARLLPHKAKGG